MFRCSFECLNEDFFILLVFRIGLFVVWEDSTRPRKKRLDVGRVLIRTLVQNSVNMVTKVKSNENSLGLEWWRSLLEISDSDDSELSMPKREYSGDGDIFKFMVIIFKLMMI